MYFSDLTKLWLLCNSPIIAETSKDSENNNNNNSVKLPQDGNQVKRRRDATVSNGSGNGASASSDVDEVFSPVVTKAAAEAEEDDPSPTVRDFTKKNDSVSYVLDLGGEHSPTGPPPLSATYLTPGSPWIPRRNLTRSASLRYPHRPYAHHWTINWPPKLIKKNNNFWFPFFHLMMDLVLLGLRSRRGLTLNIPITMKLFRHRKQGIYFKFKIIEKKNSNQDFNQEGAKKKETKNVQSDPSSPPFFRNIFGLCDNVVEEIER